MNRLPDLPRSWDEQAFVERYVELTRCEPARARSVYLVLDALSEAHAAANGSTHTNPAAASRLPLN